MILSNFMKNFKKFSSCLIAPINFYRISFLSVFVLVNSFFSTTCYSENKTSQDKYIQETILNGFKKIESGNYKLANSSFNALLKIKPEDPYINLLNGVAYHLDYISGNPDSKELAEVAYQISSRESPGSALPNIQLGRLHLDTKQYLLAKNDFSTALEKSPFNLDALNGFLVANYLTGDIKSALWSIERIEDLDKNNIEINKAKSTIYALLGDEEKSKHYKDIYIKKNNSISPESIDFYERRVGRLKSMISEALWLKADSANNIKTSDKSSTNLLTTVDTGAGSIKKEDANTNGTTSNVFAQNSTTNPAYPPIIQSQNPNQFSYPSPAIANNPPINNLNAPVSRRKWFEIGRAHV